jgi:hypothetical protein
VSQITQLAAGQITAVDVLTIELVETDEHPTVVIIRRPDKPFVNSLGAVSLAEGWT